MHKPYDHQAIEWIEDGRRECRICPTPITGWGDTLRHIDEAVRPRDIPSADRATVDELTDVGARALERMWTETHCSDLDRARVVVEALYQVGAFAPAKTRRRVRTAA